MVRPLEPREPTRIAVAYRRTIAAWVALWERETIALVTSHDFLVLSRAQARARGLDAQDDELDHRLDRTFADVERLQPDDELAREGLARARDVDAFARDQVERQLKRAAGSTVLAPAAHGDQLVSSFVRDNVALIRQMRRGARDTIEQVVRNGWRAGQSAEDIAAEIRRRYGFMRKARADLIAADQVGKLTGEMSRARMLGAGVEQGRWRTKRDGRVRDAHVDLEGRLFDLRVGVPTERFPGWPIRCRCWTEPVLRDRGHGLP